MLVNRNIGLRTFITWNLPHLLWLTLLMGGVAYLYHEGFIPFSVPWLPMTVIGTAVAFYAGFKNNQAYDRMWEARKIWGGIVNDSRTWGMMVDGFITNQFTDQPVSEDEIASIKKRLIYRHIAWLYAHRSQLLVSTSWEHPSQSGFTGKTAKRYQEKFGVGLLDDEITKKELNQFLMPEEHDRLINYANTATQIINEQSRDLTELRARGLIDDFRHMEMENILKTFYALQGKNERIKKFPLPRQYANLSRYFVGIFIVLLPFTLVPALMEMEDGMAGHGEWGHWISVPLAVLIGWIYVVMELIGDYSENPFQGMANDIPMMSLCRVIEIDMREMLGETDLPAGIKAKNGVLM